ncbi:MAG TPA: cellulose binding domain-containing protein [Pilimelia sp.]|nr:cellulose binding domain-containing protein [Pilimelia sp.]
MKPPLRLALALVVSAAAAVLPAAALGGPAAAAPPAARSAAIPPLPPTTPTAVFTKVTQWVNAYVGSVEIRNNTPAAVTSWRVEFDLPADTRIVSFYNARITRLGDHYVATNMPWNGTVRPGSSTSFGWVATGQGTPTNCTLNGQPCSGAPVDYTDPTRPGPLTIDVSGGVTLGWGPSTDDRGVVGYQVYEGGTLIATVPGTRFVYSTGPALPPRVYVFSVRAIDAAGNVSAWAYRTIGSIWRDVQPFAPVNPQVDTPSPGLLRLSWSPPPMVPAAFMPPVAGYAVYVDGERVAEVGRPQYTMPLPRSGPHTFEVRSISALDNESPPATLRHVVP